MPEILFSLYYYTIIFQTASGLKFSHNDHNKAMIGSSISMKFAYQTQTKQYNDQSHLVCVEHGFSKQNTHFN